MYRGKRSRRPVRRKEAGALSYPEFFIIVLAIILILVFGVMKGFELDTSDQEVPVNTEYKYEVTATMFGKDISEMIRATGYVDTEEIGKYTVKYNFKLFKFLPAIERNVHVVDTMPPKIMLSGDSDVFVYEISRYEEAGFEASDNYDGDMTAKVDTNLVLVGDNRYEMQYECTDSSGNKEVETRVIHIKPAEGQVYLTFDDGPSGVTETILQILEEKQVKATFFVSEYSARKEILIQKEYEAGHTIGLHGLSHDYSEIYISSEAAVQNFDNLRLLIKANLGIDTCIVRFPGGSSNTISKNHCIGVMTEATKDVLEKGYSYFDWNVDSGDAGGARTAEAIYQNVIEGIKPGRVNVVLMHDTYGHEATAEALPKIIDWCLENGYLLKAIDETTPAVRHNVKN